MRIWLKARRDALGMTMAQMSQKLGISESYYCMVENGNRQQKMDIALASKISAVLGMSFEDILTQEGILQIDSAQPQ